MRGHATAGVDGLAAKGGVLRAIETQRPLRPPYAGHRYHAITRGWLLGEVIRQTGGAVPGRDFRRKLGDRLGRRVASGHGDARPSEPTSALCAVLGD